MKKYTIFYAGLETQTLCLFTEDKFFDIVGCGKIEYLCDSTLNPFNLPFKYLYELRNDHHARPGVEKVLRVIASASRALTTSYYKKFSSHILFVSKHKIPVYEVTNINLKSLKPDIVIANVWDMLSKEILEVPAHGTINIHPSKLPQYRGAVPTLMSLKNHDKETAVTYMVLNPEMDKGGILFQHTITISENDTALSLEDKIYTAVKETFLDKIKEYLLETINPVQQDESQASYTPKHEAYRLIDGNSETAKDIINKVTLYPYLEPDTLCYVFYKNHKVYLKRVQDYNKTTKNNTISVQGLHLVISTKTKTLHSRLFLDIDFLTSLMLLKQTYIK